MPTTTLDRAPTGIDRVADDLDAEFNGALPFEVICQVVITAQRDLGGEVPPEALAEFTHRLARQRLIDLPPKHRIQSFSTRPSTSERFA